MNRPVALITGASAGIGEAFAQHYAAASHDLIIVARREQRLHELAERLHAAHDVAVDVVAADLATGQGRAATRAAIDRRGTLQVAVLNAGFGAVGGLVGADRERQGEMVALNCQSTVDLAAHVLPAMVAQRSGDLIIVSSAAAWQPIPYTATYAATKAFGLFLAEALAGELAGTGVRVIAACPGPTTTEFGRVAGISGASKWMPHETPAGVVTATIRALERGRVRVPTGWLATVSTWAASVLPRRLVVRIAGGLHRRLDPHH